MPCSDGTHYTGCTSNVTERIRRQNGGEVNYIKSMLPVSLVFYATFTNKHKAYDFEKYLKSCSGRALILKHLL
ncbi:MAG: GIY-YIG nuclease family protein [Bacteroidales bacterium]|nr:GIY-YIG nuclease family protein [Bacteroidales bacterium]